MNDNKIPILYERKEDCCGCTACFSSCPQEAITMKDDDEGFEYPGINYDICIRCFLCIEVCPLKQYGDFTNGETTDY